jgi:hypothetical protein
MSRARVTRCFPDMLQSSVQRSAAFSTNSLMSHRFLSHLSIGLKRGIATIDSPMYRYYNYNKFNGRYETKYGYGVIVAHHGSSYE